MDSVPKNQDVKGLIQHPHHHGLRVQRTTLLWKESIDLPQYSANTALQRAESCCDILTHLNKHAEEELTAELLDSLGCRLFIIAVGGLFLDFLRSQAAFRAAFCTQTGRRVMKMRVKTRRKHQLSNRSVCFRRESCLNAFLVEMVPTQGRSEQPMDHDVSVASDGRGEVSVKRNIEGVVLKKFFLVQRTSAEVECHLGRERKSTARILQRNTRQCHTSFCRWF